MRAARVVAARAFLRPALLAERRPVTALADHEEEGAARPTSSRGGVLEREIAGDGPVEVDDLPQPDAQGRGYRALLGLGDDRPVGRAH